MSLWEIILIGTGMSLDVFAYCLYRGAMVSELRKLYVLKLVAIFTGFQAGALLLGNLITLIPFIHDAYKSVNYLWMILAAVTFLCLGTYMILKAFRRRKTVIMEKRQDSLNTKAILLWAVLTSLDALIAGIGFGFLGIHLIGAVVIVAVLTALCVLVGLLCGYRLGCGPMNTFVTLGGCIVLIGGVDVLLHYFTRLS